MKYLRVFLLPVLVLLFSFPAKSQGFKKYSKVLEKELGVIAFRNPNDKMKPGTIIKIVRVGGKPTENISIPANNLIDTDDIETSPTSVSEINSSSELKFSLEDPQKSKSSVGEDMQSVAWLSFEPKSSYQIGVDSAKLQFLSELEIKKTIIENKDDYLFMQSLNERKAIIIAKTIEFHGFGFTFQKRNSVSAKALIGLKEKAKENNLVLTYQGQDSSQVRISSKEALFYGYVPFKKNKSEIQKFIDDYEENERLKDQKAQQQKIIADINSNDLLNKEPTETLEALKRLYSKWSSDLPRLPSINVAGGGTSMSTLDDLDFDVIATVSLDVQKFGQELTEKQNVIDRQIQELESREYTIASGLMTPKEIRKLYTGE